MWRKRLVRSLTASAEFFAVASLTVACVVCATVVARGEAIFFIKDLKEGDAGADVHNLQVALNLSEATQVAATGDGSPGRESGYFGSKTKDAVIRYQKIQGISPADGYVGAATRASLSALLESRTGKGATGGTLPDRILEALGASASSTNEINVFPGQTIIGKPGDRETLMGFGFEQGKKYSFIATSTSKEFASGVASTSMTIEYRLPRAKKGKHVVYLSDGAGGKSVEFDIFIVTGREPKVIDITPKVIGYGDEVVITGQGFSKTGNSVVTSLGRIDNLPAKSRGGKTTITFTSKLGEFIPLYIRDASTSTIPLSVQVLTESGPSEPFMTNVEL